MTPQADPIQDIIEWVIHWSKRLLSTLLNEDEKIAPGEPMVIPNQYGPLTIYFERLESEPDPRRVAQLNRRSRERKLRIQIAGTVQFCASLFASSNHK